MATMELKGYELQETGGGCTCLFKEIDRENGDAFLITEPDEPNAPEAFPVHLYVERQVGAVFGVYGGVLVERESDLPAAEINLLIAVDNGTALEA